MVTPVRAVAVAAVLCLAGTLAACSGDSGPDEPSATTSPVAGESPEPEPVTLAGGELGVVEQERRFGGDSQQAGIGPGMALSETLLATVTAPDNVLRVYDRATLEPKWRAKAPKVHGQGVCRAPVFASPETIAVFVGFDCSRVVSYDAATGERRHDSAIIERTIGDVPVEHTVEGVEMVDGRAWYAAWSEIGYLDPEGRPVAVLEGADLGLVDEEGHRQSIHHTSVIPGGVLVLESLHHIDARESGDLPSEWIGVRIDGTTAAPVWRFGDESPEALGVPDVRVTQDVSIRMRSDEPGALTFVPQRRHQWVMGQPDPETGALVAPLRPEQSISAGQFGLGERAQAWVEDSVLYTSARGRKMRNHRDLAAFDLASGEQVWSTRLPTPDDDPYYPEKKEYDVRQISVGTDGAIYATAWVPLGETGVLHRLDPETGEITGSWRLPGVVTADHRIAVVDGAVVALWTETSGGFEPVRSQVLLRPAAAPDTQPDPDSGTESESESADAAAEQSVTPADGQRLTRGPIELRLPAGQEWALLSEDLEGGGFTNAGLDVEGYDDWQISVIAIRHDSTFDEDAKSSRAFLESTYQSVERLDDTELAGETAYVFEGAEPIDAPAHEQDDLGYTVGTVHDGRVVTITFTIPQDTPERRVTVASILASARWR